MLARHIFSISKDVQYKRDTDTCMDWLRGSSKVSVRFTVAFISVLSSAVVQWADDGL